MQRNDLLERAKKVGLDLEDLPSNDSVLEHQILELEEVEETVVGGDRPSKLVRTGNGARTWVTGETVKDRDLQVKASQKEKAEVPVDINLPQ